ncbi:MAG TPA: PhnD/SsuA/transferrin family substrate-binding protein [Burkholderiales bacterium]
MKSSLFRTLFLTLAVAASGAGAQQKPAAKAVKPPASQVRVVIAINEGGAANADASETLFRFQELTQLVEKELHAQLIAVSVRDRNKLKASLKKQEYGLLLARPNDVPAEAIRDFGYRPVVVAKEPAQALFIVHKNSPLRTINDVRGKTIVTPDQYSNMWRIANAMLRDAHIDMTRESVKSMRDQAAIGWSMENEFFDVGVVNALSGVGRSWEKNGHRVIARSRPTPNMPLIASPQITDAQEAAVRTALINMGESDHGRATLKKIGLSGFQPTSREEFLDFLKWLGDLEAGL